MYADEQKSHSTDDRKRPIPFYITLFFNTQTNTDIKIKLLALYLMYNTSSLLFCFHFTYLNQYC